MEVSHHAHKWCSILLLNFKGFLGLKWAKWKRVLLTRSIAMVPCVVIAIVASKRLDIMDELINVEQSILVSYRVFVYN